MLVAPLFLFVIDDLFSYYIKLISTLNKFNIRLNVYFCIKNFLFKN